MSKPARRFVISLVCFLAAFFLLGALRPSFFGLETAHLQVALLFVFAIFLWTTRTLGNSQVSLLVIACIVVLRMDTFENVVGYTFGSTVFLFMLSIIIIAYAFRKAGLAARVSERVLYHFYKSERQMLLALMLLAYLLAMFLTAIAAVSITMAVALDVLAQRGIAKGSGQGKACLLGVTYAGLIGGIATPLGTPVNLTMAQYLQTLGGFELGFLHWMALGVPLSALVLACCYWLLSRRYRLAKGAAGTRPPPPAALARGEKKAVALFAAILLLFLFSQLLGRIPFLGLSLNSLALLGALLVVLPPFACVEWRAALKELDWECLLFLSGSMALGYLLYNSGTAQALSQLMFQMTGELGPVPLVFFFCIFALVMHVCLSSNTVTGTVIIPIAISYAQTAGLSPWYVSAPVIFCVSLAFVLPTESPTNIMTYNTGYYTMRDMVTNGLLLSAACMVVVPAFLLLFGGATGLYTM